MPGLNACFVDVGYERDAFLHYLDLGSHFNSYQKYLKQVQSDRKKLFPFSKASKMPELEKGRQHTECTQSRTGSAGTNRKGTNLYQGTSTHRRNLIRGPIPGTHAIR